MKCPLLSLLNELLVMPRAIIVLLLASVGALTAAFVAQFGYGLVPCEMCIWQRIPFAVVIVATLLMLVSRCASCCTVKGLTRGLLLLCAAALLVDSGLSFAHVGVEQGWFPDIAGCAATPLPMDASVEQMRDALLAATKTASCAEATWTLFGISMSTWNVPFTLGLAIFALLAWYVERKGPLTGCCQKDGSCCMSRKKK